MAGRKARRRANVARIPLTKHDIARLIILVARELDADDYVTDEYKAIIHKCKAIIEGDEWISIRV